jgi:hypothetical protein
MPIDNIASVPPPFLSDTEERKASGPGVKLSRLQRWILLRALEGMSQLEMRAREVERSNAFLATLFGKGPARRVKRREIAHLSRKEILADYFGFRGRKVWEPGDDPRIFWWRNCGLAALNNPAMAGAKVKDLGLLELEAIQKQWCVEVKAAWDRVSGRTRQTCQAIMEAKEAFERKILFQRANPAVCRALCRLRSRGLLEPHTNNNCIRLTPKGRKVARKLQGAHHVF